MADLPETDRSLFNVTERGSATTAPDRALMDDLDFAQELRKAKAPLPETAFGDFYSGLRSGLAQVGSDVMAAGATGLALFGAQEDAEELMKLALEIEDTASRKYPKSIERVEEIESIGDFTRWAARSLGEQVPVIASLLIGGGAGSVAGRLVGRGVMSLAQVPTVAAKFPLLAEKIGTGLGAFSVGTTLETGSTAQELFAATGQMQPEASLIAGAMKGALESVVPAFFGARLGLMPDISFGILRRTIQAYDRILPQRFATIATAGTLEGATETLQEAVDIGVRGFLDDNYDVLGPDARSRILNAAASGAFVGAVFGAAAPRSHRQQSREPGEGGIMPSPAMSVNLEDNSGIPVTESLSVSTSPGELPDFQGWADVSHIAQSPEYREKLLRDIPISSYGRVSQLHTVDRRLLDQDIQKFDPDIQVSLTGLPYSIESHPAGTTRFISGSSSGNKASLMRSMARFLTGEMQKLGFKDQKIILFADKLQKEGLSSHFEVKGGGHYSAFTDNINLIGLNTQSDDAFIVKTAAHEFAHFLAKRGLGRSKPEEVHKLKQDYENSLLRVAHGDMRDVGFFWDSRIIQTVFGKENFQDVVEGGTGKQKPFAALEKMRSEGSPWADPNYIFSFDEWLAEQVAKAFQRKELREFGERDILSDVFRRIIKQIDEFFTHVKNFFGLREPLSVREWLDSFARRAATDTSAVLADNEARGVAENAAVLKEFSPPGITPPPQNGTGRVHKLLTRLGISSAQANQIRALNDRFNWFIKLFYNIQQIAKLNPQNFHVNRHVELVDQWHIFQMKWVGRAEERIRDWANLGTKGGEKFSRFVFAVDAMEYLTPAERAADTARQPTDAELIALGTKYGIDRKGLELYESVREDFLAVLDAIEQTSLRDIQRTIADPIVMQQQLDSLKQEMDALRSRPYFPHSRFGKYVVVAKDAKGETLWSEHFPTKGAAKSAIPRIQAQFKQAGLRVDLAESPEGMQVFFGLPPALLSRIRNQLQLTKQQQEFLDNLIVEMAPSASFRHKLQKRANVPGFSLDAKRAYADYFFFGSRHLARIEYKPLMEANIEEYTRSIGETELAPGDPVDVTTSRKLRNMLLNHMEHILNPKPDWAGLRSAATHWYLGFGVSSAAVNLMQVPMVGWPYLASRFGDVKGAAAIVDAVRSIRDMYRYKDQDRVSDSELKIISRGMDEGILEESQAAELAGTAHQEYLGKFLPGTKIQKMYQRFAHWSMWMFQQGERFNRRLMFHAGMKLALANPNAKHLQELQSRYGLEMDQLINQEGFEHREALAYLSARDAVWTSQFQYARHARPKFMQGKKGAFFMFYMYTQGILHFTLHDPGRVRFLVMMLFMAGLMGLPGADDLGVLAKLLARNLLGKDFDVEREVRELVIGMTGNAIPPDLILHGIGRIGLGLPSVMDILGLPKADIDISRRIGLGRILPGLQELGMPGMDFDRAMSNVTTQAAGAAFGIGFNMLKAMNDDSLPMDDFKRWERAMPLALGNLTKAIRLAREERERARTGATVVDFDLADPDHVAELVFRGLGFQPTRLQRQWDRIAAQREVQMYWATRRGILLKHLNNSYDTQNEDLREDTLNAIRRFNGEVPFGTIKITGDTIRKSRTSHVKQQKLREAGLTAEKAYRPLAREVGALFPETEKAPEVTVESTGSMR